MAGLASFLTLCLFFSAAALFSSQAASQAIPPQPRCARVSKLTPGPAPTKYTFIKRNLAVVNPSLAFPQVQAINDRGVLACTADENGGTENLLWSPPYISSTLLNLTSIDFVDFLLGLNSNNDLCGNDGSEGFVLTRGMYLTFRHPKDTLFGNGSTVLVAINDRLQAVGYYSCGSINSYSTCSFLLDVTTKTFTAIGPNNGAWYTVSGINNRGTIAGTVQCNGLSNPIGFLKSGGAFTYFSIGNPKVDTMLVTSINNKGTIVGSVNNRPPGFVLPRNISTGFFLPSKYIAVSSNAKGKVVGSNKDGSFFIGTPVA